MVKAYLANQPRFQVCLLAAGFSRRFGKAKLLQAMPDGRSLIEHSLEPYLTLNLPVCVFLRVDDYELQKCLSALDVQCCLLDDVSDGLSVSVKAAAGYVEASQYQFGIFALADMPYLKVKALGEFLEAVDWQAQAIAAPFHQTFERMGNPVVFHRRFLSEFNALSGDQGAKPVIKKHLQHVQKVDATDVGFYQDVDRPNDLLDRKLIEGLDRRPG